MAKRNRSRFKFKLHEIAAFDARRGFRRCSVPRVVVKQNECEHAPWIRPIQLIADLWRDRRGHIAVRFHSHNGYSFHFEGTLKNGKSILEEHLDQFCDFIGEVLFDWDGTDDAPDPDFDCANS